MVCHDRGLKLMSRPYQHVGAIDEQFRQSVLVVEVRDAIFGLHEPAGSEMPKMFRLFSTPPPTNQPSRLKPSVCRPAGRTAADCTDSCCRTSEPV